MANTIGFWKTGARYLSAVLWKKDIPAYCRIQLINNTYKQPDGNQPDMVGYLVPAKESERPYVAKPLSVLRKQDKAPKFNKHKAVSEIFEFISDERDAIRDYYTYGGDDWLLGRIEDIIDYCYD